MISFRPLLRYLKEHEISMYQMIKDGVIMLQNRGQYIRISVCTTLYFNRLENLAKWRIFLMMRYSPTLLHCLILCLLYLFSLLFMIDIKYLSE